MAVGRRGGGGGLIPGDPDAGQALRRAGCMVPNYRGVSVAEPAGFGLVMGACRGNGGDSGRAAGGQGRRPRW